MSEQTFELPPGARLYQLGIGHYTSAALYVATSLGVADVLGSGPQPAAALADRTETDAGALARLLRFLVSLGVFEESGDGFANTELGELLRSDVPGSMRDTLLLFTGTRIRESWMDLEYCVRTGNPVFRKHGHETAFDVMEESPQGGAVFDRAMAGFTRQVSRLVAEAYDFSGLRRLLDVGGGNGALLIGILEAHPHLEGTVFDLPPVAARATGEIERAGLTHRCKAVGGDFFEELPAGADALLIKHVIHDWEDARAARILAVCREAMGPGARLLLIEGLYPDRIDRSMVSRGATANDLNMLVNTGGRQRSQLEFDDLLAVAGLRLTRVIPLPANVVIVEAAAA